MRSEEKNPSLGVEWENLDARGPSRARTTACSSGLLTFHHHHEYNVSLLEAPSQLVETTG